MINIAGDIAFSYLPSEINAAYLYSQLKIMDEINANRKLILKVLTFLFISAKL